MDRWQSKLIAFHIMMIVMLAAALTPFRVVALVRRQGGRGKSVVLTLTCFTGGVFLGTVLLFLIPEVSFLIDSAARLWMNVDSSFSYPFGELLIGIGFFVVMFIERGIVDLYRKSSDEDTPTSTNHPFPSSSLSSTSSSTTPRSTSSKDDTAYEKVEDSVVTVVAGSNFPVGCIPECCQESWRTRAKSTAGDWTDAEDNSQPKSRLRSESIASFCSGDGGRPTTGPALLLNKLDSDAIELSRSFTRSQSAENYENLNAERGRDFAASVDATNATPSPADDNGAAKTVVFFIALSLDCFLGGLSLGLQRTSTAVWTVLVGVLAHEAVVGFGLGLQLAERVSVATGRPRHCRRPSSAVVMATLYACVGPVGIAVGALIVEFWRCSEDSLALTLGSGIIQGFATGVFVYVTFFELLGGNVNANSRYRDLVAILVGFALIVAIACIPQQSGDTEPRSCITNITSISDGNFTLT